MQNQLILWDLDGTIVDSFSWAKVAVPAQFKREFDWDIDVNLVKKYFNNGWEDFTKRIAKDMGKTITDQQAKTFVKNSFTEKNNTRLPLHAGVLELLEYFKSQNIPQVLTSNNDEKDLKLILKNTELEHFFDHIIGYDSVAKPKPNGEMYLKACEKCAIDKSKTVVIEDSVTGLKASHHAQIPVVAVATGVQKPDRLREYKPTLLIENLTHTTPEKILSLKYKSSAK